MMLQNDNDNDINDDMGEEELYLRLVAVQKCKGYGLKMLITSATLYHLLLAMILVFGVIDASRRPYFFILLLWSSSVPRLVFVLALQKQMEQPRFMISDGKSSTTISLLRDTIVFRGTALIHECRFHHMSLLYLG